MKTKLVPNLKLTYKQNFNKTQERYLSILSSSYDQLHSMIMEQVSTNPCVSYKENSDLDSFLNYDFSKPNLNQYVLDQLILLKDDYERDICEYLLSCLDSNGYFIKSKSEMFNETMWSIELLDKNISVLRKCEPYGICAFNVKDCLQVQCDNSEKAASETGYILCDYLEELVKKDYEIIIKETELTLEEIEEGFTFIKGLNPKPAASFSTGSSYLIPECKVSVKNKKIRIELLEIDLSIEVEDDSNKNKEYQKYMQAQRKEAELFLNAIQKRNSTLIQIMQSICDHQKEFFFEDKDLKRLTLEMIAKDCNFSISTVSRAISNKSFEFENKYYAMSDMLVHSGISLKSSKAIQKRLKKIVAEERKDRPYSDEKIKKILNKEGIDISRRTVTKYREACHISNSRQRKIENIIWEK